MKENTNVLLSLLPRELTRTTLLTAYLCKVLFHKIKITRIAMYYVRDTC